MVNAASRPATSTASAIAKPETAERGGLICPICPWAFVSVRDSIATPHKLIPWKGTYPYGCRSILVLSMDTVLGEFITMRTVGTLKSRQVLTLKPPKGRRSIFALDGSGLYLQASIGRHGTIRRSWTFRYQLAGKRHEMGLGSLNVLSLKEARLKAQSLRRMLLEYVDPLTEKKKRKAALLAEQAKAITFEECAKTYIDLHGDGWSP